MVFTDEFCSPADIVIAAESLRRKAFWDVVPSLQVLKEMQASFAEVHRPSPAVQVMEPLLPTTTSAQTFRDQEAQAYLRIVLSYIKHMQHDRTACLDNAAILEHLLLLSLVCSDLITSGSSASSLQLSRVDQQAIVNACEAMTTYILGATAADLAPEWHTSTVQALLKDTSPASSDVLATLLGSLFRQAKATSSGLYLRLFGRLLAATLRHNDTSSKAAEQWLGLAQSVQKASQWT